MTSELNRPDDRNYGALFAEIFNANLRDSLDLRKQIDAGIRRVLDDATKVEQALNRMGHVTEEDKDKLLQELNMAWDSLRFGVEAHKVTGKLRATEYADEEEVVDLVGTGEPPFRGLGSREQDIRGYFYRADGFSAVPLGFDVEEVDLAEHGKSYRLFLQFGLDEDMPDRTIWFTVYPEELDYIEPPQPSRDGAELFISDHFPELFAAIQELPDDCKDDERIRRALDDFVATIDFTHVDSDMGTEEIIATIETYITDRLAFDNSPYTINISGMVYGRTMKYDHVPRRYTGALSESLIAQVRLFPMVGPATGEGIVSYRPAIEIWYLVPERGGGRTPIFAPIDSIQSLTSHRPDGALYPFSEDTVILPNEDVEWGFDDVALAPRETIRQTAPISESIPEKSPDAERSTEELLVEYLRDMRELHAIFKDSYVSKIYDTEEDAKQAADAAIGDVANFVNRWAQVFETPPVMHVSGPALLYQTGEAKTKIDGEKNTYNMEVTNIGTSEGDMFSSRIGRYGGWYIDHRAREGAPGYEIIAAFSIQEMDTPYYSFKHDTFPLNTLEVEVDRRTLIDLTKDAEYEIPELAYIQRQSELTSQLSSLPTALRNRAEKQLATLREALEGEVISGFKQYEGIDGLRDIALSASGDEKVAFLLALATETVLGSNRLITVSGPAYDDSGDLVSVDGVLGRLTSVIAAHPYVPSNEVILVLKTLEEEDMHASKMLLLPLSTVETLGY